MNKPWEIVGTYHGCINKSLGTYSSRPDAEQDAQKYKRFLSAHQIHIRVVWNPPS